MADARTVPRPKRLGLLLLAILLLALLLEMNRWLPGGWPGGGGGGFKKLDVMPGLDPARDIVCVHSPWFERAGDPAPWAAAGAFDASFWRLLHLD